MAKPETILEWLKEAGAYAFACEDPERPGGWLSVELLINGGTVGVRVRRGERQTYNCLTWAQIERAEETNPLVQLIDKTIAGI